MRAAASGVVFSACPPYRRWKTQKMSFTEVLPFLPKDVTGDTVLQKKLNEVMDEKSSQNYQ